ncbi:ABC transporter permease [Roseivirga misakiensis]|nr:ABC transporter permease [Roseivirga misakiensis]
MKKLNPPHWANRFLEWYCAADLVDEIQGDLIEAYYYRQDEVGVKRAYWWFVWDVLRFFRPSSFEKRSYNSNQIAMLKNYLIVSLRNFKRHRGYSFINLSGLIVGITACLLISIYVLKEVTFDNFHPKAEQTYRVVMDMYGQGELKTKSAPVYPAVAPNLLTDFPEIEMSTRILPFGGGVYSVRDKDGTLIRYNEDKAVLADHNFFDMFGFELINGDRKNVLSQPSQIVISESTAKRYFGTDNPIGQSIFWRGSTELKVSGVFKDFPKNSHMQFELITSLSTWNGFEDFVSNWGWYDFYTFVKVADGVSQAALDAKLGIYLDDKKAESYERNAIREVLWTQQVGDIHLKSVGISWDMGENGGGQQIYFLLIIAALILLIAWVNYINLATARAVKRAKEVGVRKVVGAGKANLLIQFLVESFLYNFLAILTSFIIVWFLTPVINRVMDLSLEQSLLIGPTVLGGLFVLVLMGTICSGFYPALVLTSFKPLTVLKGGFESGRRKFGFRQILVVFQFTASITLILGTFLVFKQLNYMRNYDLGIDLNQTLVLQAPSSGTSDTDLEDRLQVFANKLEEFPEVEGFTISSNVPGVENFSISGFHSKFYPTELRDCYRVGADEDFTDFFDIKVLAGRTFSKEMKTDTAAVLLNRMAVKHLGFSDPESAIGEKIDPNSDRPMTIIGVIENYHQATIKDDLNPVLFVYNERRAASYYSVKLSTDDYPAVISKVETAWDQIYPDNPFDFFFLDELFDRQYKADRQFNTVFVGFAVLAIFVACLGLFGLVSFTTEQAKKEIGIRKVLGASVVKLVFLLAKDYAKLISVAIVLAFPLSFYLMREWLNGFAYQTEIGLGLFILGGFLISMIAFTTVSYNSFKAAKGNPVNALRDE